MFTLIIVLGLLLDILRHPAVTDCVFIIIIIKSSFCIFITANISTFIFVENPTWHSCWGVITIRWPGFFGSHTGFASRFSPDEVINTCSGTITGWRLLCSCLVSSLPGSCAETVTYWILDGKGTSNVHQTYRICSRYLFYIIYLYIFFIYLIIYLF